MFRPYPMVQFCKLSFVGVFFFIAASVVSANAQITLPKFVCDSMVVQRDVELTIWGWAKQGEQVKVTFNGKSHRTIADSQGSWRVIVPPVKAGGPYTMEISGSNTITVRNILAGDVWLFSGQSNMVHTLALHKERYANEIAEADNPLIRNFTVPTATNLNGQNTDFAGGSWKAANPKEVLKFSVVAYFFAKEIFERYHVPVGIINASVGGTPIEAWTSEEGLKHFSDVVATIQKNKDTVYVNNTNRVAFAAAQAWNKRKVVDKGLVESKQWFDPEYQPTRWRTIAVPGYWEDQGIRDLDGVVWYRKEIELPADLAGAAAKVALGRIVDADFMYVNGVMVGNTTYQYPQRRYQIPPGVLEAGKNIFVVRVINNGGKGGFVPDKPYYLSVGDQTFDLKGYWEYKVGEVFDRRSAANGISLQNQPTSLFNAMIAPVTGLKLKGVAWYQGESNAAQPEKYSKLLPALITDWRRAIKNPDLPFLYVQLPNFMEVNYSPEESSWAQLREAQLKTLAVPNTGMAVAIDLGEWNDIHPGNKKPVGERLALAARKIAYGEKNIVSSGPLFQSFKIDNDRIVVNFSDVGSGLISNDGEPLRNFAIAGADRKFVRAKATIENNSVAVWSDQVPNPQFVRYAWADNPDNVNFYNKENLPASPFRTDQ